MGVAVGDYDHDGLPDLYLAHFTDEYNTLYHNLGGAGFEDVTARVGLVEPALKLLAFGTVMADFDRDGREDLFVANGHIDGIDRHGHDFQMRPQLFTYVAPRWFERFDTAGPYFAEKHLGRAAAACDYDNDGDLDLAVVNQGDPAALLRNEADGGHWLKVRLIGADGNRRGIGARVTVRCAGQTRTKQLVAGSSYCASHEPALLFGLGDTANDCDVSIVWPNGQAQEISGIATDQTHPVRQAIDAVHSPRDQ